MNQFTDEENLKIPAYLRNKVIVRQSKQQLILTALDRKEAGLSYKSKKALAPKISGTPRTLPRTPVQKTTMQTSNSIPEKIIEIGEVTHFLEKINVAIIKLTAGIKNGDQLFIQGKNHLFLQPVEEMQIERKTVKKAAKGAHIGLKVKNSAKVNGLVYKI